MVLSDEHQLDYLARLTTFRWTGAAPTMIILKDARKHYQMGHAVVRALDGIDLVIREDEFVAVMGPSGSGKSTLMNILGCLDTLTGGTFSINNRDTGSMSDDELADLRNRSIGFVFQNFNLLPRYTALTNVAIPLLYAGKSVKQSEQHAHILLDQVGLGDRTSHIPSELSGGEQQRVAIARALVNKPAYILADEPTGNLDSVTSGEIMKVFNELHRESHTVIMVTHEHHIAACAHRVITLQDGKIAHDASTV